LSLFELKKKRREKWSGGRYMLLLLRLMDAFIKRLRSPAGIKRGSGTCATFQRMRQTKNKKEDQDIGSPFLLVRQINKREMMKEKEKRKDIRYKMMMMMTTLEACQLSGSSI
jgi:hypothetical protein